MKKKISGQNFSDKYERPEMSLLSEKYMFFLMEIMKFTCVI